MSIITSTLQYRSTLMNQTGKHNCAIDQLRGPLEIPRTVQ